MLTRPPLRLLAADYRPTPLVHYAFPSGGEGLYLVRSCVLLHWCRCQAVACVLQGWMAAADLNPALSCPAPPFHLLLQLVDERGNFREDNFTKMRAVS